jgi:glycosyltransferase involved in cell wall biosynthesis
MAQKFGLDNPAVASPRPESNVNAFTLVERELVLDVDTADRTSPPHGGVAYPFPKEAGQPARTLIVEGWRFLPHSYAIVNQWHLLALLRRPSLAIKVVDMPFPQAKWRTQEGLFDAQAEQILKSAATAGPDESADLTLRMFYRYDFSPSRSRQTVVFGTLEQQLIRPSDFRATKQLQMPPPSSVRAMTPSLWSAEGFYRAGFAAEQVLIVPHGVDVETFHPMPHLRSRVRSRIPVADDDFIFLSIGAMTGNKGMDLLLQAFAAVSHRFPHARLLLKGMDPLYTSKEFLLKSLWRVPPQDLQRVSDRVIYFGNSCSYRQMALLFQAADAYVSSYRAEAFNMPVLEAAACGLPVICTAGGSTDDFVTDAFARRIESKKISVRIKGGLDAARLEPNVDHLIELMTSVIEDHSWRRQAAERGPEHVRSHYTWDRVTDTLFQKLFS